MSEAGEAAKAAIAEYNEDRKEAEEMIPRELQFHQLRTREQIEVINDLRTKAASFWNLIEAVVPHSREASLAKTHIEEALVFADKAVALYGAKASFQRTG